MMLAVVEGKTEAHFIKQTLPRAHVITPFSNGKTVDLDLICEEIIDSLEVLGGDTPRVIVLLDREKRTEEAGAICDHLRGCLECAYPAVRFYIGVSDRHLENWIAADGEFMSQRCGTSPYTYKGDGSFGKVALQEALGNQSIAPQEKADYLKRCVASRIRAASPSFESFVSQIDFEWYWAHR